MLPDRADRLHLSDVVKRLSQARRGPAPYPGDDVPSERARLLLPLADGALYRQRRRVSLELSGRNHAVKRGQFGIVVREKVYDSLLRLTGLLFVCLLANGLTRLEAKSAK